MSVSHDAIMLIWCSASSSKQRRWCMRTNLCCWVNSSADFYLTIVVVDSVMHHFRTEFNGRGELSVRQISLGRYLKQLQKLADEFGVAVLVTNQVMAKVDGGFGFGDNKLPIGGHILAHAVSTRISLSKLSGEQRKAKLTDSPSLPESDCVF